MTRTVGPRNAPDRYLTNLFATMPILSLSTRQPADSGRRPMPTGRSPLSREEGATVRPSASSIIPDLTAGRTGRLWIISTLNLDRGRCRRS